MNSDGIQKISITTGTMLRGAMILLGVFLIWYLSDVLLVILTAIVIASFVESAVPYFKKWKVGRVVGVAILYIISVLMLATLFYLFAPLLITEVSNFAGMIAAYLPGVEFLDYFTSKEFSGAKDIVAGLENNLSVGELLDVSEAFVKNLSGGFINILSVAFGSIFNFILIIVISFYLSIQEKGIENFLRIVLPNQYENYAIDLWQRTRRKISFWIKGQMLLALMVGVLTYLVLALLGVEYALILAIIAGIMELIPYGVLIAIVPAVMLSYAANGISQALVVTGAYLIIHQFEAFLLAPLLIGKTVGLSPLVVILSVMIGFELAGVWGIVLGIPVAVFIMEFMSDIEKKKLASKLDNAGK
jgi:predicted PurR-regulated permease PerM